MIRSERDGDVVMITIERDERRNALDVAHCVELRRAVEAAAAGGARALLVTGAGSAFCAGADFDTVADPTFRPALYAMLYALADAPLVSVAGIDGPAIGAGTQLALACDLRVATERSTFGVPTARYGLVVDPWTIDRLAALAGGAAARSMLLGASVLDGAEAHRVGIVDRLGDVASARAWAREIGGLAPLTLRYSKRVLDGAPTGERLPLGAEPARPPGGPGWAAAAFEAVWSSDDLVEGQRARTEKRPPRFEGR